MPPLRVRDMVLRHTGSFTILHMDKMQNDDIVIKPSTGTIGNVVPFLVARVDTTPLCCPSNVVLMSPMCATRLGQLAHSHSLDCKNIFGDEYKLLSSLLCDFLHPSVIPFSQVQIFSSTPSSHISLIYILPRGSIQKKG